MESFEEVYQKYLKEVYCFLLRLSGDREIAEELTQQTFAIAFEKLENFRGECKLSVWLCQIAKHEYYAWTKKQKRYANKLDEKKYLEEFCKEKQKQNNEIKEEIEVLIGVGSEIDVETVGFTPRTKRVIENAFREARKLGTEYIGTLIDASYN